MKSILVLGTEPSVHKNLVTIALCRTLTKKGFNVFPLKILSYTNDVYRTTEGKNIGRFSMIESLACNKIPSVSMNPLLIYKSDGNHILYNRGRKIAKNDEISSLNFKEIFEDEMENLDKEYDYCIIEACDNDILNTLTAQLTDASIISADDSNMELLSIDYDFHENFTETSEFTFENPNAPVDVAILFTPYMSSLMDVAPLSIEKDVSLRIIKEEREFGNPDLLIIPGSSNTCKDMVYVKKYNLDNIIREYSKHGLILGICGGYQLLGQKLIDPLGVESEIKEQSAIGLLNVDTIFEKTNVYNKVSGKIIPLNIEIEGSENHFGISYNNEINKDFIHLNIENQKEISKNEGAYNDSFNVFGTYLHRCFEMPYFREYLLNRIREKKSLEKNISRHYNEYLIGEVDKITDKLKLNMNLSLTWKGI